MGQLYEFLGLSTGVIIAGLDTDTRRAAYAADVTYGTNNEFGFDYLRDNMAHVLEQKVQRPLHYAIVDEVDSILIDEARTPLIISGPAEQNSELYLQINAIVPNLVRQADEDGEGDYSVDEKSKQVHLTEAGHDSVEELLQRDGLLEEGESLYDPSHIAIMHHLNAALRPCQGVDGLKGYIKPLRRKKVCPFNVRTKRLLLLRSRISSVCTRSYRA